jgi:L-aminopeptidase/D-esterase-like protein
VIWEVEGISVGHWSDPVARTGCTVVLAHPAAVASGEVRGGAPATREFALLDPLATVERVDAVVLAGGSAFGLAAADGVASWCEEQGRGVPTQFGRVPIVVGMGLFDLGVGDATVRPGPAEGRAACGEAAGAGPPPLGPVGAGTGATVGSWRGRDLTLPGGICGAVLRERGVVVAALIAVNAWGDVVGHGHHGEPRPPLEDAPAPAAVANTTIGVVATDAPLDAAGCHHLARGAHDGLARAVDPPHGRLDGDAFVALSTGTGPPAPLDLVRALTVEAVDAAIRSLGRGRPSPVAG